MISPSDLISQFNQVLSEHWGYIWGTAGVLWTAERQRALQATTDSNRQLGRRYGSRWIGHRVADCSGLFSWAFRQLGGTMYHGSNTMYLKWCADKGRLSSGKRTDGKPLRPGTAVFVWNGTTYSHVGLYVGNNTVIEAMGTLAGVTTTPLTLSKWTHWGELTGVDYSGKPANTVPASAPAPAANPAPSSATLPPASSSTLLRRGSKGAAVRDLQSRLQALGFSLGVCGVDGDFGPATESAVRRFQRLHGLTVDGIAGPQTLTALASASP